MPSSTARIRRQPARRRALGVAAGAVLLGACTAGSGEGLDAGGRPLGEGGDIPPAATLESLQANLFDPFCVVCHAGAAAPLGLRLDSANSFSNLVGVRSRQTSLLRVAPGNPDQSYLIQKLEGSASEGEQMPLGGPPLSQELIDYARQWILDGAPPDDAPSGTPPVVVSVDPAADAVLVSLPQMIDVGFDRDIDASTINSLTFVLERSVDGVFDNADDVLIDADSVALSAVNPRLATMALGSVVGAEDDYRITLRGSGANVVLSVDGRALDGDFDGTLPSGDGTEGGDFVSLFAVAGLQPTLESIQDNIFSVNCATSGCHSGPTGPNLPGGMDLTSSDASFAALVGVASLQVPSLQRVTPGDADNSYLVQKLEGTAAVGGRMPAAGPPLDATQIDTIREWIDTGAGR